MSMQLVLSVNASADGMSLADNFHWCWITPGGVPAEETTASGDREALRAAISGADLHPLPAWLILPGCRVNTRELEYSEKEKKHLRNLLPFQLEDSVIGDIEDLHFALATPSNGKVVIAFANKIWLEKVFAELAGLGIEVTHCWSAPLLLPLTNELIPIEGTSDWSIGLYQDQVHLRYTTSLGFSVSLQHAPMALQMAVASRNTTQALPNLHLRAASKADLARLAKSIPSSLHPHIKTHVVASAWELDFSNSTIDLCQGDFSQRLPMERWWKLWKSVAMFAGVCVVVYLGTMIFEMQKLKSQNNEIRKQIEMSARTVIPQGRILDAEKQLTAIAQQSKPAGETVRVLDILAVALPQIAAVPSVSVKGITFTGDTGELNINIQADSFGAFETLSENIRGRGLNAEILSANVQGNVQSARLKVSK